MFGSTTLTASRVKPLAWAGIFGAAILIVFGIIDLVAPSQVGNKIVNPVLFQIGNGLVIFGFIGWVLICFAFYASGAAGRGWLAKIALVLAILGAITASITSAISAITIQNFDGPEWTNILLFGLVLFAPVLLGIAALWARTTLWQALYPIFVVGVLSMAMWGIFSEAIPSVSIFVQGLAWIGFAIIAMKVKLKA